jgi:hypothetical protein
MVFWCVSTHTLLPVRGTNQWHTGCTGGVDKWNERGRRSGGHSSIGEYAAKGSSTFSYRSTHTHTMYSHMMQCLAPVAHSNMTASLAPK